MRYKHWIKFGRKGETIGGGFFVMRRGKKTGRIGCKSSTLPFEHGSLESACKERDRLSKLHPEETFKVFKQIA